MKRYILIALGIIIFGLSHTRAEVGDLYEDSVRKHGASIAKMTMNDRTIYLFQQKNSIVKEVYNKEGRCIESGFTTTDADPPLLKHFQLLTPTPSEDQPESATADRPIDPLVLVILIVAIGGIILLLTRKRKQTGTQLPRPEVIFLKNETQPELTEPASSPSAMQPPCLKEAAFRLSRNEMGLFKALNTATANQYIVTYHISLDRIIDIMTPRFASHLTTFSTLKPVFVDFVLHNPQTASVEAIILLQDDAPDQTARNPRRTFIKEVMKKNNIPLVEIPLDHRYSSNQLRNMLKDLDKQLVP